MKIGRFFSFGQGQVGQYLSHRVLLVRSPFQTTLRAGNEREVCYFGFEKFNQVQKFTQYLSYAGYRFQVLRSGVMPSFPYSVKLVGNTELAKTLAYWDRIDQARQQVPAAPQPLRSAPLPAPIAA